MKQFSESSVIKVWWNILFIIFQRELGVPRNTCVNARALSEKGNNTKCIESKFMTSSGVLPLILVCLYVKFNVSTCKTQEKVKKVDNSKSIDVRVMYLKRDASSYHTLSMD